LPAFIAAISCGIRRIAAIINAQFSSAVAYDGRLPPMNDERITPWRAGTSVGSDVRIRPEMTDEPQFSEPLEQCSADRSTLANKHQHFGIPQPGRQNVRVFGVVIPNRDVVMRDFVETLERPNGVAIVIENRNIHFF
jgi:hypothetical protein